MQYISIIPESTPENTIDLSNPGQRYLRLPHPRTGLPQLYLPQVCSSTGKEAILEVVRVSGGSRRTWFMGESTIQAGNVLIHHKIDPLFFVIPFIAQLLKRSNNGHLPFQPLSDIIAALVASPDSALPPPFASSESDIKSGLFNEDVSHLLAMKSVRKVLRLCCDRKVIPAAPQSPSSDNGSPSPAPRKQVYYRPSQARIINHLKAKVEYLAAPERFERFDHLVRTLNRDGLYEAGISPDLSQSARHKAAIEHLSQYLPAPTVTALTNTYDLEALAEYLANRHAATLAAQQPKVSATKEAKGVKRKAPPASRGVESLKKVNTSSMSKLTSFFKPKDGKK